MHQRATATLLDANAREFLTRHEVPLESLRAQDEAVLNELLEAAAARRRSRRRSRSAMRALDERMAAVTPAVTQVDPTLEGAARSTLTRMQDDLKKLQAKIIQAAKRKDETLRRQFQHAQAQAFPGGAPAGARGRLRVVPEQVRPRARRAALSGAAARPAGALGPDAVAHHLHVSPGFRPASWSRPRGCQAGAEDA